MLRFLALLLLVSVADVSAFAPLQPSRTAHVRPTTVLNAAELPSSVDTARISFFIWFFGASGGAGIARSAFPRMYKSVRTIQNLKGVGPAQEGPTIGINPLCGYPDDISIADVKKIANNKLSIEQIVDKFPVEGNFLTKRGYLAFQAFEEANKGANPLAIRAIFDTFNSSTDIVSPVVAQELIDEYKTNPKALATNLLKAKLIGFSSIFTLLFLLGLADVVAFGHAKDGWFPDWPGLSDLPASLFSSETGLTKIPDYWLSK